MVAQPPEWIVNGSATARRTIALAHGAGAGMDSPFMETFAVGLADHGLRVIRFEFPYMASRRRDRLRRPPDREVVLRTAWASVIDQCEPAHLVIGGKSLGGRIASMMADEAGVLGLVCLGYPFHPAGKPDRLRIEHLKQIKTSSLIVQGERDALGNRSEVAGYPLSDKIQVHWLEDGDHSLAPRKRSGRTTEQNWKEAIAAVAAFVGSL